MGKSKVYILKPRYFLVMTCREEYLPEIWIKKGSKN